MRKDVMLDPMDNTQKILVCITIQENSRRLIRKGAQIATERGGQLHILHVEKGESIFLQEDAPQLVQDLFEYASELGGEVHVVCDEHVPERIAQFIREEEISTLVLGEPIKGKLKRLMQKDIENYVSKNAKEVEVIVLERKEETRQDHSMIKSNQNVFSSL
ncbi:MAG: universal stress protein [Epulopiscium sp.]|nr:universal stress protein [Candidatus Epulonipiscium sp.]